MVSNKEITYTEGQLPTIEELNNLLYQLHKNSDSFDTMTREAENFWVEFERHSSFRGEKKNSGGFFSSIFGSKEPDKKSGSDRLTVKIENENIQIRTLKEFKQYEKMLQKYTNLREILGLYIYGSPGCGKTFIMDLFYNNCHLKRKKRTHFNEFMLEVHSDLHKLRSVVIYINLSRGILQKYRYRSTIYFGK